VKPFIGTLLLFILASVACSFSPAVVPTDFPTPPASATPTAIAATQTPLPAPTSTAPPPSPTPLPAATQTLAPSPTAPVMTIGQLRNAILTITGSDQVVRTMTFKDGKYQQGSDQAEPGFDSVVMGEKFGFGDLNGDGLQDAVITIDENFGGTGLFVSVVVLLNDDGYPNAITSTVIEDRAIINNLEITNGEIRMDAIVHGPGDPACCAAQPSSRTYRLVKNALVLTRLTTKTPNGTERVIQIDSPANGAEISGAFIIRGSVTISPFENNLVYRIYSPDLTNPIEQAGFIISADGMGGPGTFELNLDLNKTNIKGPLRIDILDTSPADGSTLALASLSLISK